MSDKEPEYKEFKNIHPGEAFALYVFIPLCVLYVLIEVVLKPLLGR